MTENQSESPGSDGRVGLFKAVVPNRIANYRESLGFTVR